MRSSSGVVHQSDTFQSLFGGAILGFSEMLTTKRQGILRIAPTVGVWARLEVIGRVPRP